MGRCFRKTTETEDYVFITMQEYDLTLDKLILKGELKLSERLEYFKQIVDGVIYIHGKGITHGCLNPSNICIKEGHLMIGNFYKKQNYGSNTPANSSHMYLYLYSPPEKITEENLLYFGTLGLLDVYFMNYPLVTCHFRVILILKYSKILKILLMLHLIVYLNMN